MPKEKDESSRIVENQPNEQIKIILDDSDVHNVHAANIQRKRFSHPLLWQIALEKNDL